LAQAGFQNLYDEHSNDESSIYNHRSFNTLAKQGEIKP